MINQKKAIILNILEESEYDDILDLFIEVSCELSKRYRISAESKEYVNLPKQDLKYMKEKLNQMNLKQLSDLQDVMLEYLNKYER